MYLVLFKQQAGEKSTAYSFVTKSLLNKIPKEIIKSTHKLNIKTVPSKEVCQEMVEQYEK